METRFPQRKKIRLENFDYNIDGGYFITICTAGKENLLSSIVTDTQQSRVQLSDLGKIAEEAIQKISEKYPDVTVDRYVIMPNHIHMILFLQTPESGRMISAPTIPTVVGQMKRYVSKAIGKPLWQKSFFDHVIRNVEDYENHAKYISHNPEKWIDDELYIAEN